MKSTVEQQLEEALKEIEKWKDEFRITEEARASYEKGWGNMLEELNTVKDRNQRLSEAVSSATTEISKLRDQLEAKRESSKTPSTEDSSSHHLFVATMLVDEFAFSGLTKEMLDDSAGVIPKDTRNKLSNILGALEIFRPRIDKSAGDSAQERKDGKE